MVEFLAELPRATIAAGILVFAAVALAVVSVVLIAESAAERRRRAEALRQLQAIDRDLTTRHAAAADILRQGGEENAWVRAMGERLPQLRDLQRLLDQGGMTLTVQGFLLMTVGLAVALGLGAAIAFGWVAALAAAAVGAILPYLVAVNRRKKRLAAFEGQLPNAVDLMGRALRAGHPLSSGLRMVADESQDPLAVEFRQVFEEQRFGMPFEESLVALAERVPLVDVRILVTAILVQREVGGNLAEILDKIAYVVRERFTLRRQLRVITAEGRMSMWVLMSLPVGVGGILYLMNPAYVLTLFQDPIGHVMLYAAVVMGFLGFLWIRRIVDIEI
jgi:tight adherence protein B